MRFCSVMKVGGAVFVGFLFFWFCASTAWIVHLRNKMVETKKTACFANPPSRTKLHKFTRMAVAADSPICAQIGRKVIRVNNGTVADAAIATILCQGAVHPMSSGIGGGHFLMLYKKNEKKVYTLDAREVAPKMFNETVLGKLSKSRGVKFIAVPGEIAGLRELHKKFGKVEWKILVGETVNLLCLGFTVSRYREKIIKSSLRYLKKMDKKKFIEFRNYLINPDTRKPYKYGDTVQDKNLANTYAKLANNPDDFYNGSIADHTVETVKSFNGWITKQDLAEYKVRWRNPIKLEILHRNVTKHLYMMLPPSSGLLIGFTMKVLQKFDWANMNISNCDSAALFFHRLSEVLKFAFAKRSMLGDSDFVNITRISQLLLSDEFAEKVKNKISDTKTFDTKYYEPDFYLPSDQGTAQLNILHPNGDAVSATMTINRGFGSFVRDRQTGIIFNNEMDDFSVRTRSNSFGLPPSKSNLIEPGKRPMSSMSPVLLINPHTNEVELSLGGSGGTRIISGVAQVAALVILLNQDVKTAIDYPRVHHQLLPDLLRLDGHLPKKFDGLMTNLGHKNINRFFAMSKMQAILRENRYVTAGEDYRKSSSVAGD